MCEGEEEEEIWLIDQKSRFGKRGWQWTTAMNKSRERKEEEGWIDRTWSSRPTADREKPPVESDRARVGGGRLWFRPKYKDQTLKFDSWRTRSIDLQTQRTDQRRAKVDDEEAEIDDGEAEIDDEQDRRRVNLGEEQRSWDSEERESERMILETTGMTGFT